MIVLSQERDTAFFKVALQASLELHHNSASYLLLKHL